MRIEHGLNLDLVKFVGVHVHDFVECVSRSMIRWFRNMLLVIDSVCHRGIVRPDEEIVGKVKERDDVFVTVNEVLRFRWREWEAEEWCVSSIVHCVSVVVASANTTC